MKHNFILYILLSIIILLLGYIVLKEPINNYLKRQEIIDKANLFHVPEVYVSCYSTISDEGNNYSEECIETVKKFSAKREKWDSMIRNKTNISCSDFDTGWDAFEFYNYVGGEFIDYVDPEESTAKGYFTSNAKCSIDPYGLDTDGDCTPCEQKNNDDN